MTAVFTLLTILSGLGVSNAQSLRDRYEEQVRRELDSYREERDALNPELVAREKVRGFQMMVGTMVARLAESGFYVDRPRLLAAATVATPSLEVSLRSRPANGRGQIVQEMDVIFVRNEQVCRMRGYVTTLNSLSKSLMQRFIEYSSLPHVLIQPDACVALNGPRR